MRRIRTLHWPDSIRSWSGRTNSDLAFQVGCSSRFDWTDNATDSLDIVYCSLSLNYSCGSRPKADRRRATRGWFAIDEHRIETTPRYRYSSAGMDGNHESGYPHNARKFLSCLFDHARWATGFWMWPNSVQCIQENPLCELGARRTCATSESR